MEQARIGGNESFRSELHVEVAVESGGAFFPCRGSSIIFIVETDPQAIEVTSVPTRQLLNIKRQKR